MGSTYRVLQRFYHIPNGGKRSKMEAAIFKAMGVRAGVPDLFLPVASGNKHGLYIEMKADKGKPTENQLDWLDYLAHAGYEVAICYDWLHAADTTIKYLGLPARLSPLYNGED
jgi:hypothetical protein